MVHGPCGGVRSDATCEVGGELLCPFVDRPVLDAGRGVGVPLDLPGRPLLLADVSAPALDLDALRRAAATLAPWVDCGLTGDHGAARVQLPPVLRAQALQAEGLGAWVGLNCRDRNRVALEGELAGLAAVGVTAVHCVTGDHTTTGHRPDALPVFDVDGPALATMAAAAGLAASVPESPLAPPTAARAGRAAAKARAGATVCIVNHTGSAKVVADFMAEVRAAGAAELVFLACVPVVVSAASAAELATFTGLATPPGMVDRVLEASDPFAAGVDEATRFAESLLELHDLAGIDLSGVPGPGEDDLLARAMAEIGRRLR
jgi:5,10-methylenetetrahydrofolate reductase